MDQNNIPNCNWSLRQQTSHVDKKSEKSAIFAGDKPLITAADLDKATLTSSGNIIKSYLTKNGRVWTDSLIKGKSGSCSFKAATAKQTDGKISGVLKSGCTYTSSNENVATVSGSDIILKDYGFAILTGNDGSQSVVTVQEVAGQTIQNLENILCQYPSSCVTDTKTSRTLDFDGDGIKDYPLSMEDKTNQGSKFTLTALDPTIVSVSKSKCTNGNCSNTQMNQQVWMLHFHSYGKARVVASAPAITGYRAMQDTFEITYQKGLYNFSDKFKDQTIALGGKTTTGFQDKLLGNAVTYTYNGKESTPYLTKSGDAFVGGNQNAIVVVTAHIDESDNYQETNRSATIIIGDATNAVNLAEWAEYTNPISIKPVNKIVNSLKASVQGSTLQFTTKHTGLVKVDVYDALGVNVMQQSDIYAAGNHSIDLNSLSNGSYTLVIRQGSQKSSIRWTNK